MDIHAVLDNYAVHKAAEVKARFEEHPRWRFSFTPAYALWLNTVDRVFAYVERDLLQRGDFQ